MRTIPLMLIMLFALPAMAQTELEIEQTWLAAEIGAAGEDEKVATANAKAELKEFLKSSYEAICKKRETYESNPGAFVKEMDRIFEGERQRRLARYHAIRNRLNATEEANFDTAIAENMSSTSHGESFASYSALLAAGRTTVPKTLNRICGEQK